MSRRTCKPIEAVVAVKMKATEGFKRSAEVPAPATNFVGPSSHFALFLVFSPHKPLCSLIAQDTGGWTQISTKRRDQSPWFLDSSAQALPSCRFGALLIGGFAASVCFGGLEISVGFAPITLLMMNFAQW